MNTSDKKKWVKALRSGDFPQARESLRDVVDEAGTKGYCCLGVLCEISGIGEFDQHGSFIYETDIPDEMYITTENGVTHLNENYEGPVRTEDGRAILEDGELNDELLARFGITSEQLNELIEFNDIEKYDFNQIADVIEATL